MASPTVPHPDSAAGAPVRFAIRDRVRGSGSAGEFVDWPTCRECVRAVRDGWHDADRFSPPIGSRMRRRRSGSILRARLSYAYEITSATTVRAAPSIGAGDQSSPPLPNSEGSGRRQRALWRRRELQIAKLPPAFIYAGDGRHEDSRLLAEPTASENAAIALGVWPMTRLIILAPSGSPSPHPPRRRPGCLVYADFGKSITPPVSTRGGHFSYFGSSIRRAQEHVQRSGVLHPPAPESVRVKGDPNTR